MLTRLYIDNFRSFQNFEYFPESKQLLLGVKNRSLTHRRSGRNEALSISRCRTPAVPHSRAKFLFRPLRFNHFQPIPRPFASNPVSLETGRRGVMKRHTNGTHPTAIGFVP